LWLARVVATVAGAGAGDVVAPPGRVCVLAGLPELVRAIPGVIMGGRGTDVEAPFGRFCPEPPKEGRAIEGTEDLGMFEGADGWLGFVFSFDCTMGAWEGV